MNTRYLLLSVLCILSAFVSSAENRFYCEDFAINPGETKVITFYLNNDVAYTGFQADIYFPEGITVNKDEYDDYIFELTSRKGKDHQIVSALQTTGAIRILSYSLTNRNYLGNEGAFVTCTVTADENFSGTKEMRIDNIIFGEVTEVETPFDPTTATITGPSEQAPENVQLSVLFPDRGKVAIAVPYNKSVTLTVFPNDVAGFGLSSATFNGVEIFDVLDENYQYTTPALTENAVLSVVYVSVASGVDQSLANRIKVSASNGTVRVHGAAPESEVLVYDLSGKIVRKSTEKTFTLGEGIYVLNVEGLSFKFAM